MTMLPLAHDADARSGTLQVLPLDAAFGVRVRGRTLQDLASHPDDAAALRSLVARHRVLVLEDVHLDAEALVALAAHMGTVRPARVRHPSLSGPAGDHIFVSLRDAASIPAAPPPTDAAHMWHVDYSQSAPVPQLSMLYAVRMPANGSRNGFADMVRVHAALPEALKQEIAPLQARHYTHPRGVDVQPPGEAAQLPWAERERGFAHPLVMHDPDGQPYLFLPARIDSPVVGLDEAQSRALLERLWPYVETHGTPWEYALADAELLIWDNRALLHKRSAWPLQEERLLWFLTTN